MKHLLTCLATVLAICAAAGAQTGSPAAPQIKSMRAMPYYPATGEIARNIDLFNRKLALTGLGCCSPLDKNPYRRKAKDHVIDENTIESGTTSVYVDVEVLWENQFVDPKANNVVVRLEAKTATGRILTKQDVSLASIAMPPGAWAWHVPFLVYGTGCEAITLTASGLVDGKSVGALSRSIPFLCVE